MQFKKINIDTELLEELNATQAEEVQKTTSTYSGGNLFSPFTEDAPAFLRDAKKEYGKKVYYYIPSVLKNDGVTYTYPHVKWYPIKYVQQGKYSKFPTVEMIRNCDVFNIPQLNIGGQALWAKGLDEYKALKKEELAFGLSKLNLQDEYTKATEWIETETKEQRQVKFKRKKEIEEKLEKENLLTREPYQIIDMQYITFAAYRLPLTNEKTLDVQKAKAAFSNVENLELVVFTWSLEKFKSRFLQGGEESDVIPGLLFSEYVAEVDENAPDKNEKKKLAAQNATYTIVADMYEKALLGGLVDAQAKERVNGVAKAKYSINDPAIEKATGILDQYFGKLNKQSLELTINSVNLANWVKKVNIMDNNETIKLRDALLQDVRKKQSILNAQKVDAQLGNEEAKKQEKLVVADIEISQDDLPF